MFGEIVEVVKYFGSLPTSGVIDDLISGYEYTYRVKSSNLVGDSLFSPAFTFYVESPPSEPTNFMVTSYDESHVSLAWNVPLLNGGGSITNYLLYRKEITDTLVDPTLLVTLGAN